MHESLAATEPCPAAKPEPAGLRGQHPALPGRATHTHTHAHVKLHLHKEVYTHILIHVLHTHGKLHLHEAAYAPHTYTCTHM